MISPNFSLINDEYKLLLWAGCAINFTNLIHERSSITGIKYHLTVWVRSLTNCRFTLLPWLSLGREAVVCNTVFKKSFTIRGGEKSLCMQSYDLHEHKALILNVLLGKKLAYYRIAVFKNNLFTGNDPNALQWVNG